MNKKSNISGIIKAARIHLSILKLACIFLGVAIGYSIQGSLSITGIIIALLIGFFSHGASSISNEWADAEIDQSQENRTFISGGSGSVSEGIVNRNALAAGWILCIIITLLISVLAYLFFNIHWFIIVFTAAGLFIALNYSLPPFKFSRHGLGEIAALIAYSVPVFFGTIILQIDKSWINELIISYKPYLLTIPPALTIFSLLSLTQIPDLETDRQAGKKSIAVILSPKSVIVIAGFSGILCTVCFIVFAVLNILHFAFAVTAALLTLITGIVVLSNFSSQDKPKPEMMKKLVPAFKLSANTAMLTSIIAGSSLFIFPVNLL
jgi:1,4-dihydroxy-2-naphthoate polyprenyltransferase